ncbi:MAG: GIY-YIG nuclease family protein, partial [Porphyromonas sp.]|nr:GIY-YIG nuclease family protein [Porphyromonas sp.]
MLIPKKDILETLSSIPDLPGCYRYLDKNEVVVYIGKAKSLRRRIASYFQKEHVDAKTRALVNTLQWLEYFVVDTEHDALLLEYNLIKEYRPRYNIMLKHGNFYPYICIKKEAFPRIFVTHKPVRDGSEYFGPYPSRRMANTLIGVIKKVFLPRTCSLNLTSENILLGRFRVCLNYHIHRCLAPCVGKQKESDYDENVRQAREVLRGNISSVMQELKERMFGYASDLKFEEAHAIKRSIEILENYQAQSAVVSRHVGNALVCSFSEDSSSIYINYLEVREGNIVSGETLEYKKSLNEEAEEWLSTVIQESLSNLRPGIKELILPHPIAYVPEGVSVTIPQRGDKKKLLDLSLKNVEQY